MNASEGGISGKGDHLKDNHENDSLDENRLLEISQKLIQEVRDEEKKDINNVLNFEHAEKIKSLTPRLLKINPQDPFNSKDLIDYLKLYDSNLVSDDAFKYIEEHEQEKFEKELENGGMMNVADPSEEVLDAHYPLGYITVKQQIVEDLLGISNKPGKYYVLGLYDEDGVLRATLSYRRPPVPADFKTTKEYQSAISQYVEYLHDILNPEILYLRKGWDYQKTCDRMAGTWELDTMNVHPEWKGASALLFAYANQHVREETNDEMKASYLYRFSGISVKDDDTEQRFPVGENYRSGKMTKELGFLHMGQRAAPFDKIIRMINGDCHEFDIEWRFELIGQKNFNINLQKYLEKRGLSDWKYLKKAD